MHVFVVKKYYASVINTHFYLYIKHLIHPPHSIQNKKNKIIK